MKFLFECEDLDGLVIMDKAYLDELDEQLLYDFDICLDRKGKSELVYDFPDEKWEDVYNKAFHSLEKFSTMGKMVLFLLDENCYECNVNFSNEEFITNSYLDIISGDLIIVSAGELIQCATYKVLEMEPFLELDNVKKGIYGVKTDNIYDILLKSVEDIPEVVKNLIVI